MPTEHKKSNDKKGVKATNVPVKPEPKDLYPMSHYVDDRVELIRQIFSSLKSSTIKSIAPDFLQGKTTEALQEFCLDELLGISKKRLLSIINSTKCPSDTESTDSDVENIFEHISLEEISSDSQDDKASKQKSKKLKKKLGKTKEPAVKNGKPSTITKPAAEEKGKKPEISVLELLELQARARAIRSQLALEPVTKIELDTDNESGEEKESSTKAAPIPSTSATISKKNNSLPAASKAPEVRPVRLKRNFRQRQAEDYEEEAEDDSKNNDVQAEPEVETTAAEPQIEKKDEPPIERSPSPDLIPIYKSPETFFISSESENEDEQFLNKIKKSSCLNMPPIPKEIRCETEDEYFLRTIKETTKSKEDVSPSHATTTEIQSNASNKSNESTKIKELADNQIESADAGDKAASEIVETVEVTASEAEDGEIMDEDDVKTTVVLPPNEVKPFAIDDTEQIDISSDDSEGDEKKDTTNETLSPKKSDSESDRKNTTNETLSPNKSDSESDRKNTTNETLPSKKSSSDDSDSSESCTDKSEGERNESSNAKLNPVPSVEIYDDDIIDLGKDEEMDFEMKEEEKLVATKTVKKKTRRSPRKKSHTITEQEKSSADESTKTEENVDETEQPEESWGSRWLRGKNVTKVMATSRLANKVRTKIKQKRKTKAEVEAEKLEAAENARLAEIETKARSEAEAAAAATYEVGSVQHYEEIRETEKVDGKTD